MDQRIKVLDEGTEEEESLMSSSHSVDSVPAGSSWTTQSPPQVVQAYEQLPLLGLRLSRTPSFLDKLNQLVETQNSTTSHDQANHNSGYAMSKGKPKDTLQNANKLKAENFPISFLKVGSWQRASRNEGDLVAKFYFAKRKLIWEILESGLKSKIEIQWSELLSFKAVLHEGQPGILQIELKQPPSFHHEIDPRPRKHTQWKMASDFTGGQALTIRRHYLQFPCGALDKPLERLLNCDNRLYELSRRGFPALDSPYFQPQATGIGFSFDFGGQFSNVYPDHQQPFSILNVPPRYHSQNYQTYEQTAQKRSGSPISDENISNNQISLWHQELNNGRDSLIISNQVGGMAFSTAPIAQANSTPYLQSNDMHMLLGGPAPSTSQIVSLQETGIQRSRFRTLNYDVQDMLMDNLQTEFSNAGVAGENQPGEGIPTSYGQDMIDYNDHVTLVNNSWSSNASSPIYPQLASWQQPQIHNENMSMNHLPAGNKPFYPSVDQADQFMGYFPSDNGINEVNDWTWKS